MTEENKYDRRQFMGGAAMTTAATKLIVGRYAGTASTRTERPEAGHQFSVMNI